MNTTLLRKETRKEEIIRVASKLFKTKGYTAVTMRDIAKEMDIKAASLYNHITSKEAILEAIVMPLAHTFSLEMTKIIDTNQTCIAKLKALIALHVKIALNNPYKMASLNNDWVHLEKENQAFVKLRSAYENKFKTNVQQGIQDKELKQMNAEVFMFSVLNTLNTLHLWLPKKENIDEESLVSDLVQVLLEGSIL